MRLILSLFILHRLAFFVMQDDDKKGPATTGFKALKQSDKTALFALTKVLRLNYEDGEAKALRQNIADFLDKATLLTIKKKAKR